VSDVRVVGVYPGAELRSRPRLFMALSQAFPEVRFEARGAGERAGLAALIEFGGESEARSATAAGVRALAAIAPEGEAGPAAVVDLAAGTSVDRRLHGQALPDRHLVAIPGPTPAPGAEVLARVAEAPVWIREGKLDVVAAAAAELAEAEPLRDRLGSGRSLALLPLVELLRELTRDSGWRPPPLRAAFVLDDPNLHWPSYGFLSLPRLRDHAAAHGYHLAMAMVPLDARLSHPGAVRILREGGEISLCVHGNDHFGGELGEACEPEAALALAAQALRRTAAFERRTGVPVSPVMVPPHEECSEAMAGALARTGFAAITMTRPFPWLSAPPLHWLTAAGEEAALTGWRPADATPSGLPVMLRHPLAAPHFSPTELALRAYLDQPLILYGHHEDLAGGLDLLAERSAAVNRLGAVRWGPLGELARAGVSWRLEGDLLRLRPHSRWLSVEVPAGVRRAVVEVPWDAEGELVRGAPGVVPVGETFEIGAGERLELKLQRRDAVAPDAVTAPPHRPWPVVRRLAGETRDRLAPARHRLRGGDRSRALR
jgi:hypothetical protein